MGADLNEELATLLSSQQQQQNVQIGKPSAIGSAPMGSSGLCDFVFRVGDVSIQAHKCILHARYELYVTLHSAFFVHTIYREFIII